MAQPNIGADINEAYTVQNFVDGEQYPCSKTCNKSCEDVCEEYDTKYDEYIEDKFDALFEKKFNERFEKKFDELLEKRLENGLLPFIVEEVVNRVKTTTVNDVVSFPMKCAKTILNKLFGSKKTEVTRDANQCKCDKNKTDLCTCVTSNISEVSGLVSQSKNNLLNVSNDALRGKFVNGVWKGVDTTKLKVEFVGEINPLDYSALLKENDAKQREEQNIHTKEDAEKSFTDFMNKRDDIVTDVMITELAKRGFVISENQDDDQPKIKIPGVIDTKQDCLKKSECELNALEEEIMEIEPLLV